MKTTLQLLCLGLLCMVTLSSCDTYVGAGGYAGTRPGYYRPGYYNHAPAPRHYPSHSWNNNGHYSHNHPSYYRSPSPRPAGLGVGARVDSRGLPLNVNSRTRLGLF